MKLFIKNMVCNRCNMAVRAELGKLGLEPISVTLGEIELAETVLSPEKQTKLGEALKQLGFELIDDRRGRIIEKIKNLVINTVHHSDDENKYKFSELISAALHYDYPYLSNLFSEVEGITIEQFIIRQKVERVKELLVYDELSLSDIAFRTGYSSVAHLSAQFKKVTGLPPSHFKRIGSQLRRPLDNIKGA